MYLKRIGKIELRQERKRRNKMATAVPRVSVQPDRVTFTVQHEIKISHGDPSRAAASESEWLSAFTKIIEARESRGLGVPAPQIQALYHSSALPVPIGNAGMEFQSVTNGLVSACLFAFAEVHPTPSTAKNPRDSARTPLALSLLARCSTSAWCSAPTTSSFLCWTLPPRTCSKTAKRHATCLCRTRAKRCAAASPQLCVFIT
jgi:hypothetical protein